jgi:hypothetical protein
MKNKYFQMSIVLLLVFSFNPCISYGQSETNKTKVAPVNQILQIIPGEANQPPSDAIILFDGSDLNNWTKKDGTVPDWVVQNGVLTVMPDSTGRNDIYTKQEFGDIQLHLEFKCPETDQDTGQHKGNSGVFIQGRYEIQILDSYENSTYRNRQCGSIYNQYAPLVNACKKPGEWQFYDIIFTAPRFNIEGSLKTPGKITVFQNGVLIHNCAEIREPTGDVRTTNYKESDLKQPLVFQEHSDLVSFRNIWIREL